MNPLRAFFARYDTQYDTSQTPSNNFDDLVGLKGWGKHNPTRKKAKREFKETLVNEFNVKFGTDPKDLKNWQGLCRSLNIPEPDSIKACKQALQSVHVNIVDLTVNGSAKRFKSVRELSDYTLKTQKVFPREMAKAGGVLRALLREIANPP